MWAGFKTGRTQSVRVGEQHVGQKGRAQAATGAAQPCTGAHRAPWGPPQHTRTRGCRVRPQSTEQYHLRSGLPPRLLTCNFTREKLGANRSPATWPTRTSPQTHLKLSCRLHPRVPAAMTVHPASTQAHKLIPGLFQGQCHIYSRICPFLNRLICVRNCATAST